MINFETLKLPKRINKTLRTTLHKLSASSRTMIHIIIKLRLASKLPTKINISNNTLVPEMRRNVTLRTREIRQSSPPSGRIRLRSGDISGYRIPSEEPSTDTRLAQLKGVNAAAGLVHCVAVCIFRTNNAAARIPADATIAVFEGGLAGLFAFDVFHCTTFCCM